MNQNNVKKDDIWLVIHVYKIVQKTDLFEKYLRGTDDSDKSILIRGS